MLIVFVSIKQIYSRIFYSKNNLPDLNIRLDIRTSNYSHFCRSYQRWGDFLRIDYTFCSPAFQVNRYLLISNPWSDHKQQHCVLYLDKCS